MNAHKMPRFTKLYPLIIVLVSILLAGISNAGSIYLADEMGNDSIFITGGVGDEFELRLMVDDSVVGLGFYQVDISFDKFILDTVDISDDSSLFQESGEIVIFAAYLRDDSTTLRIQSMIFASGISVDGPGLLAKIRLRAIGSGTAHLDFDSVDVRGPGGSLDVEGLGAVAFVNVPPDSFDLLSPPNMEELFFELEDSMKLEWSPSSTIYSGYSGDFVRYEVYYGTDPGFSPEQTTVVPAYSDTSVLIPISGLNAGWYYWKVKALNTYDFERWSNQTDWYVEVAIATYPTGFSLISPPNGGHLYPLYTEDVTFEWQASTTSNPDDSILYDFYYSSSPTFIPGYTTIIYDLVNTSAIIPAPDLMGVDRYYWKVRAHNTLGYITWCDQSYWDFFITVIANPDIFYLLEPDDQAEYNLNAGEGIHLSWSESESVVPDDTITYTIYIGPTDNLPAAAVFDTAVIDVLELNIPAELLPRREWHYWRAKATNKFGFDTLSADTRSFMTYYRGDPNGDDIINIFDITHLISFLYMEGPAPYPLVSGDPNCDDIRNIFDVTYLISFLYLEGPAPCTD